MNLDQLLYKLRNDDNFMANVTNWHEIEPKDAVYSEFGEYLDDRLVSACSKKGNS